MSRLLQLMWHYTHVTYDHIVTTSVTPHSCHNDHTLESIVINTCVTHIRSHTFDHIVPITMIVITLSLSQWLWCHVYVVVRFFVIPNKSVLFSITYRDKTIQFYINCVGYINGNLLNVYINDNLLNHIRFQFRSFWVHKTW